MTRVGEGKAEDEHASELPGMTRGEERKQEPPTKLPDFLARLTMKVDLDYRSLFRQAGEERQKGIEQEARLEQVYLGATMIGKYHPDVTHVSRAVLQQFYGLTPSPDDAAKAPARLIRKLVTLLSDIRGGRVSLKNADRWWTEDGIARSQYDSDDSWVELVFAKAEQGAARQLVSRQSRGSGAS